MRVALVGNQNNNFFSIIRYLRDRGVDADLLTLSSESEHFLPQHDTYGDEYLTYTKAVTWGSYKTIYTVTAGTIREDLAPYDFIIACDVALAFIEKASLTTDVFIPYGADLRVFPFIWDRIFTKDLPKVIKFFPMWRAQKSGRRTGKRVKGYRSWIRCCSSISLWSTRGSIIRTALRIIMQSLNGIRSSKRSGTRTI